MTVVLATAIVLVLVCVWLAPGNLPRAISRDEAILIYERLGSSGLASINAQAQRLFDAVVTPDVVEQLRTMMKPTDLEERLARESELAARVRQYFCERVPVGLDLLFWWIRRWMLFEQTFWIWGAFLAAAAGHGWFERERKKTDFSHTSPVRNAWARMMVKNSMLLIVLLTLVPVALDPALVGILAATTLFGIGWGLANVQKQI